MSRKRRGFHMLKEGHGTQNLDYIGTIIDIETIGEYCHGYPKHDSREYKDLKIVVFGYINRREWDIYCAQGFEDIPKLGEKAKQLLVVLEKERPLYAFNCHHETSVFFHHLNAEILMDRELQSEEYERKEDALRKLGIVESYGDPFHTKPKPGKSCMLAWETGHFGEAIRHNRACLLKEQALLLHGRGIKPIPLNFRTAVDSPTSPSHSASFQPWTKEQESYISRAWSEGKTLNTIAQDCKRTPNAIWMRLQKLNKIPYPILYTIEKNSCTIDDLSH